MKKIIFGLALIFAGVASATPYLYWMVNTDDDYVQEIDFDSARIVAARTHWADQQVILSMMDDQGNVTSVKSVDGSAVDDFYEAGMGFYASIEGYASDGYAYWVELLCDGEIVAHSEYANKEGLTYAQAVEASYVGTGAQDPADAVWMAGNFTAGAIPEPTSGLLLLIGMAGLALKRRRA